MAIDKLTVGEVRELQRLLPRVGRKRDPAEGLPFKVGDKIIIRTVTMIDLGRVRSIGPDFYVLEDGGWVADTGRFGEMLEKGTINEFERAPSWFLVGRGAVCDLFPWAFDIPKVSR